MHQLCNKVGSMRLGDCSEGANNLYVRAQLLNEVQHLPARYAHSVRGLEGSYRRVLARRLVGMLSHADRRAVSIRPARKAA